MRPDSKTCRKSSRPDRQKTMENPSFFFYCRSLVYHRGISQILSPRLTKTSGYNSIGFLFKRWTSLRSQILSPRLTKTSGCDSIGFLFKRWTSLRSQILSPRLSFFLQHIQNSFIGGFRLIILVKQERIGIDEFMHVIHLISHSTPIISRHMWPVRN